MSPKESALVTALLSQAHLPASSLFRRLNIVGKGAFGSVYRGVHIGTGTVIALKIIDLDTEDGDEVADIQREVALLRQLKGGQATNTTQYYGCWLEGPRVWIAMDYASGGSVRTLMKCTENNVLPERYIAIIVREVLIALAYLHKLPIIHRDIKAANILLTAAGRIMLCDFGVSALMTNAQSKRTTFMGTPYWMAPEVLTTSTGSTYDTKADIWSLGVTIYEMAVGKPPHTEVEPMRVILLIPKIKPPRLSEAQGGKDMREFMGSCLRELPADRLIADELARSKWMKSVAKVPVSTLKELIYQYDTWVNGGGVRESIAGNDNMDWENQHFDLEESAEADAWQYDTMRSMPSDLTSEDSLHDGNSITINPDERTVTHIPTSDKAPPRSLRLLFEDANAPPPEPTPRPRIPLGPFSNAGGSLLPGGNDLGMDLTVKGDSSDLHTARQADFAFPSMGPSPFPFGSSLSSSTSSPNSNITITPTQTTRPPSPTLSPPRQLNYKEVRTSKGLANISIPPPPSERQETTSLTELSPLRVSPEEDESFTADEPRPRPSAHVSQSSSSSISSRDESQLAKGIAGWNSSESRKRLRNVASPSNFTFPPTPTSPHLSSSGASAPVSTTSSGNVSPSGANPTAQIKPKSSVLSLKPINDHHHSKSGVEAHAHITGATLLAPTMPGHHLASHSLDAFPRHQPANSARAHSTTPFDQPLKILPSNMGHPTAPKMLRQASETMLRDRAEGLSVRERAETLSSTIRPPRSLRQGSVGGNKSDGETGPMLSVPRGLKDYLKLSPTTDRIGDLLPPSPSAISPMHRYFPPGASNLSNSTTSTPDSTAPHTGDGQDSLFPSSVTGHRPSLSNAGSYQGTNPYSSGFGPSTIPFVSSPNGSHTYATGPAIRPIDYGAFLSSSDDVHLELSRTVEELTQWLSIVDAGLCSALDIADEDVGVGRNQDVVPAVGDTS